jgi:hypothetical protein
MKIVFEKVIVKQNLFKAIFENIFDRYESTVVERFRVKE